MRVLSPSEPLRLSRAELMVILRRIASELTAPPECSVELRNAHVNLRNIRAALARPDCIVDLTGDDRATIQGALLWMADKLKSDQREQARALWAAKGKRSRDRPLR